MQSELYITLSVIPAILFMIVSLPVSERRWVQEGMLGLLWLVGIGFPLWYAGQVGFATQMSSAVWSWGTGMKMGVWLFSMSLKERQASPFALTVLSWRQRREESGADRENRLWDFVKDLMWHTLLTDITEVLLHACDVRLPVKVFSAACARFLGMGDAAGFDLGWSVLAQSTAGCFLFAVYLQKQMELTYDAFMILFVVLHRGVGPGQARTFLAGMIQMPAAFDSPWHARSLRDFWGKRWHTYYNECFYRLGYLPIRWAYTLLLGARPPRWLPALAVFTMSGLMHEYFLYAASGPDLYFHGSPLFRGGFQFLFFISQMVCIGINDRWVPAGRLETVFAFASMILTCHLFVVPYFMSEYLSMPRLSFIRILYNLWHGQSSLLDSIY